MDPSVLVDVGVSLVASNPKAAGLLAVVPVVQGLCGLLARWTKRSHATVFNTAVSKIAAFPMPHAPVQG